MDPRLYRFLKYTAITLGLAWLAWGVYDGFFKNRAPGDSHYHAANKLFEDGDYERAKVAYAKALTEDVRHIHALRGLARSQMQLGQFEQALMTFNDAIQMEPEFGGTYANRGIMFDRMGEHEKALKDYQTALRLDPEIADGPHWLIRFLRKQAKAPPGIAERAAYISAQLKKPKSERLLTLPEIDQQQRTYKK